MLVLQGRTGGSGKTSTVHNLIRFLIPPQIQHLVFFSPSDESFPFDGFDSSGGCLAFILNDWEPTSHLPASTLKNVTERAPNFPLPQKNSTPVFLLPASHLNPIVILTCNDAYEKIRKSKGLYSINDFDCLFGVEEGRTFIII